MEKTAEFKTTRKAARKPSPSDPGRIRAAIALIDAQVRDHIDTLVQELAEDHGLKLTRGATG